MRQLSLTLVAFSLVLPCSIFAQQKLNGKQSQITSSIPEWRLREYTWTSAPWNQSDLPYLRARQKIDKEVKTGIQPDALMKKYEAEAALKPNDPLGVFQWAYSSWLARKQFADYDSQFQRISKPAYALLKIRFPGTYQYARTLFLTQAWEGGSTQLLVPVGRKLLLRDPRDNDVKYYLAGVLSHSPQLKDRQQAIRLTRQLIAENPAKTRYRSRLGHILFSSWMRTHSRADATQAISAYKGYLQLKTKDTRLNAHARKQIKYIQTKQPEWDAYRAKHGAAFGDLDFVPPRRSPA